MKPVRILIVDDEPGIRQSLCGVLEDEGYRRTPWKAAKHVWARWTHGLQLVLLDVWLHGMDGMEAWRASRKSQSRPAVVVMISGHGKIETAVKATKLGAFDFLEKPLTIERSRWW